ncbi:Hypothetical predicted protein [Scomber scombrus]|uniref:Uncharacterized protein n=1 Tax=Scomber scombrus TaxID=13677 RepID=A0AAV1PIN4_SCOSC
MSLNETGDLEVEQHDDQRFLLQPDVLEYHRVAKRQNCNSASTNNPDAKFVRRLMFFFIAIVFYVSLNILCFGQSFKGANIGSLLMDQTWPFGKRATMLLAIFVVAVVIGVFVRKTTTTTKMKSKNTDSAPQREEEGETTSAPVEQVQLNTA